jgi:hypothetical protein
MKMANMNGLTELAGVATPPAEIKVVEELPKLTNP